VNIGKSLETLIGVSGLLLGATYVIGGLIVNLRLSRYGVTQYQVLRVKYLVVGVTYLTNFIAILFLAAIPAVLVAASGLIIQQIFLIASVLASVLLLSLWARSGTSKKWTILYSWRTWVLLGTLSTIFPLMVALRMTLNSQFSAEALLSGIEGLLAGILSFVGPTYFYAVHLYGYPNTVFGANDPIGMGIPVEVQLAGEAANIALLASLGVPASKPETTDKVLLLDETETHYIIGLPREANIRAVEIAKDMVKAILYC
jgi:hypothetical protein